MLFMLAKQRLTLALIFVLIEYFNLIKSSMLIQTAANKQDLEQQNSLSLYLNISHRDTSHTEKIKQLKQKVNKRQPSNVYSCIFIGCSCSKNKIKCPSDSERDAGLLFMFPKRNIIIENYPYNELHIDLANNILEMIPDDRFAGLEIKKLDLSNNHIQRLSASTFRDVAKLNSLILTNNFLNYLNINTFVVVEEMLVELRLENNFLNQMESTKLSQVFTSLKRLEDLYLDNNKLYYMPNLIDMKRLEKLSMESNFIELLVDTDTYGQLLPKTLVDLNLRNNQIKQINENSFANLVNLKYINLASNQISAIAENSFAYLTNLLIINLSQNNLKHIPSRIFFTLVNLELLDLSSQKQSLTKIDDYAFDRANNAKIIKKIDLKNNSISKLDNKTFCSKNQLKPYINVKEIDLSFNFLKKLDACIMQQLAMGFNDTIKQTSRYKQTSRVLLKFTNFNYNNPAYGANNGEKSQPLLACNCDITRTSKIADLEGFCRTPYNQYIPLRQYDCSDSLVRSSFQLKKFCSNLQHYECIDPRELNFNKYIFDPQQQQEHSSSTTTVVSTTSFLLNEFNYILDNSSNSTNASSNYVFNFTQQRLNDNIVNNELTSTFSIDTNRSNGSYEFFFYNMTNYTNVYHIAQSSTQDLIDNIKEDEEVKSSEKEEMERKKNAIESQNSNATTKKSKAAKSLDHNYHLVSWCFLTSLIKIRLFVNY
jgi:Leucine-rich repeat (LRR) protein